MRIFDLASKDIQQVLRDKRSLLFLLAMPVVFTLFMGFAYRSGSNTDSSKVEAIKLGWVNNDPGGPVSEHLLANLGTVDTLQLVQLASETAKQSVTDGSVAGALTIPAGYSQAVAAGQLSQLTLLADTGTARGQSLNQALRAQVVKTMSSVEIGRLGAQALGIPGDASEISQGFSAASGAWNETDNSKLIKVEMAVRQAQAQWYGDNPFNQASPGMLVMFAIFGLTTSGQVLVQERKSRTLQRMMTTSMRSWEIVAGHTLAMFALVFTQVLLLLVFGQLALGVSYFSNPLGSLLVSIGLCLWIASMGLLIGVVVKDDSQVVVFSLMAMFIFSALGGLWFPLEATRGAFGAIGRLMPSAFAMSGYQNILIRGLGLGSVGMPAAMLFLYALVFFGVAVWLFRKVEP